MGTHKYYGKALVTFHHLRTASIAATSIFLIVIMASNARFALSVPVRTRLKGQFGDCSKERGVSTVASRTTRAVMTSPDTILDTSVVNSKSDLHYHLVVFYRAILDVTSNLIDFEPIEISHRLRGSRDCGLNSLCDRYF
ncbi:hypothetical protein LPU83_pLPU83c_0729 (plasmid) [Rhizobium favelukesii]|uniref:Uncharacterized protein n=1 Tax=Rhizobium favelukesii TaxID=348824 RepID=W6S4R7_9HYPH|nr:hypothetical protein LPU83_pLPU83c_0729 [Rhizobium favelukesii]